MKKKKKKAAPAAQPPISQFDSCINARVAAKLAESMLEFTSPLNGEVIARAVAGDEVYGPVLVEFLPGYDITPDTLVLIAAWVRDLQKPAKVIF